MGRSEGHTLIAAHVGRQTALLKKPLKHCKLRPSHRFNTDLRDSADSAWLPYGLGTLLNRPERAFNKAMDHDGQRLAVRHKLGLLPVFHRSSRFHALVRHDLVYTLGPC